MPEKLESVDSKARWEELISICMVARERKDESQWILGDAAMEATILYGNEALDKLAAATGVAKETFRRYRQVSQAWPPSERVKFLSHRHHQLLASLEDKNAWADKAHDNGWSCEALSIEIKKSKGEIDQNFVCVSVSFVRGDLGRVLGWYNTIRDKWPELLNEADHPMADKLRGKLNQILKGRL